MLWVLKRTVSIRRFFERPKPMFLLMDKKILTILCPKFLFIWRPVINNLKSSTCIFRRKLQCNVKNDFDLWYHLLRSYSLDRRTKKNTTGIDKQKALRRDCINNVENTDLEMRVSGI